MSEDSRERFGESLADRLKGRWKRVHACPRPGVSTGEIEAFEARYAVRLTQELRDYFLGVDGMEDGRYDDKWITHFSSLGAVRNVREGIAKRRGIPDYGGVEDILNDSDHTFPLVDVMLGSHYLAARLTGEPAETGPIFWICGTKFGPFVDSFTELAERYLADPDAVLKIG